MSAEWLSYMAPGKGASTEFEEVAHEVNTLHTAIKELIDEVNTEDSILNRSAESKKAELNILVENCRVVLIQLEKLLTKYKSLGSKSKRTWDRIKFGTEGLQVLREKLTFHTSSINLFLTTLGTGSLGRIEKKLDEIVLEIRSGKREPSILSATDDDEGEAEIQWNVLKSELLEDGFTRTELETHKVDIKIYLQQLLDRGKLQEMNDSVEEYNDDPLSFRLNPGKHTAEPRLDESEWPIVPNDTSTRDTQTAYLNEINASPLEPPPQQSFIADPTPLGHVNYKATTDGSIGSSRPNVPRSPSTSYSHMDHTQPSLSTLPPPPQPQTSTLKRRASVMSEEYREEVSEYDESGRLRKRTTIHRSESASPIGAHSFSTHSSPITASPARVPLSPFTGTSFLSKSPAKPSSSYSSMSPDEVRGQVQLAAEIQAGEQREIKWGPTQRFLQNQKELKHRNQLRTLEGKLRDMTEENGVLPE